ncbi:MAG TPA: CpsB/CapC family capsule biosynthesis tyrosine phosphatase [Clostridia bacterium]|nr:CpsB/CapC family capsule biosynthesis tyrosine phosphatase [Clostridia bacterium]
MLDRHCHILYGIDDGAVDREESVAMLIAAKAAGITDIVATPHVNGSRFDFFLARERKDDLAACAGCLGIRLQMGSEVRWSALSELLIEGSLIRYCREGTNEILVDFGLRGEMPRDMIKKIFALQRQGLQVVIAHPERYERVQKEVRIAREWLDMGCNLQLDANVLLLPAFDRSRRSAVAMLKQGMYESFASDAHCARDYERFSKAVAWIKERYLGSVAV